MPKARCMMLWRSGAYFLEAILCRRIEWPLAFYVIVIFGCSAANALSAGEIMIRITLHDVCCFSYYSKLWRYIVITSSKRTVEESCIHHEEWFESLFHRRIEWPLAFYVIVIFGCSAANALSAGEIMIRITLHDVCCFSYYSKLWRYIVITSSKRTVEESCIWSNRPYWSRNSRDNGSTYT